jgi:hypothetical protein
MGDDVKVGMQGVKGMVMNIEKDGKSQMINLKINKNG